jgi:RHS repeat-associated protein
VNKAVWRWDSDPFGSNATANSAPNENPNTLSQVVGTATLPYLFGFDLAFPGQKRDRETGKHYNYFRDYDPSIGRYFESDPVGLRAGYTTFAYVDSSPSNFIDRAGLMRLPGDPVALPPGWDKDPGHKDPNGDRYRHPGGDWLDFHRGRPGMPGWRGKDHWHHNGGDEHLAPGDEVPDPPAGTCDDGCKEKAKMIVMVGGTAYIVYRCIRMLPSLLPPFWWTIPGNVAAP